MKKPLPCLVGSGGRTTAHDAGENQKEHNRLFEPQCWVKGNQEQAKVFECSMQQKIHDLQTGTVWLKIGTPKKNSPPQKTGQVLTTWLGLSKSSKNQGFPFTDILPWHWDLRFFGLRDVTNSNGHWEGSLLGLQLNDSSTWAPKMTCDFHPKFATSPLICFFWSVCSNVLPRDDSCCCYIQRRHSLLRRERTAFGRSQKSDSYPPGEVARAWPVDSYSPENEPGNHPEMKRKLIWTKPPFWVPFFIFRWHMFIMLADQKKDGWLIFVMAFQVCKTQTTSAPKKI